MRLLHTVRLLGRPEYLLTSVLAAFFAFLASSSAAPQLLFGKFLSSKQFLAAVRWPEIYGLIGGENGSAPVAIMSLHSA